MATVDTTLLSASPLAGASSMRQRVLFLEHDGSQTARILPRYPAVLALVRQCSLGAVLPPVDTAPIRFVSNTSEISPPSKTAANRPREGSLDGRSAAEVEGWDSG